MGNLVQMFVGAWLHPWKTMEAIRAEGYTDNPGSGAIGNLWANVKKYALFVLAMGLISGIITAIGGMISPQAGAFGNRFYSLFAVLVVPIVSFIGSFLGAVIVWALVDGLLSGKMPGYGLSYKIIAILAAFSPVSAVFALITVGVGGTTLGQILAIGLNVWATIVMIMGIIIVRKTSVIRTWVVCGLLFAFLLLISLFAGVAARRELGAGADFGNFGNEAGLSGDDLDAQLEDLANEPPPAPSPK
jgi:hypothetical protein